MEAQTHQRISLFEKCLYLRSRSLSPPLIACASSGLAMFTGKVGRGREGVEEEQQEDRPSPEKEGGERRGTRRDRRARAAAVFISRETPLHWPKSSPVCCHSTLRRRSVRQPHRAAPPGEPLECGNSPRSVRRPRLTTSIVVYPSPFPGICSRRPNT